MPDTRAPTADAGFRLHHLGIAVPDLGQATAFYAEALGLQMISGPVEDPIQKVGACFLGEPGRSGTTLELICPLDGDSPVNGYLKKGIGAYHVCWEVPEIAGALAALRAKGCLVISGPVPAVAFGGRNIAWCFTPTRHLLELLEQNASC